MDDGDFRKARGFLVTFSTLAILAWYFSVDLTSFSMLGVPLRLKENTDDIWLAISLVNIYFILRYIQTIPDPLFKQYEKIIDYFHAYLIKFTISENFKEIIDIAKKSCEIGPPKNVTLVEPKPRGIMAFKMTERSELDNIFEFGLTKRRPPDYRVRIDIPYVFSMKTGSLGEASGTFIIKNPRKITIYRARLLSTIKGSFLTPWFTDKLFPIILSILSSSLSIKNWINITL
ncbi:hypothetical protein HPT09_18200 [Pseudomonas aeruginosa]|uniref:hypothetical protein n=1 Tax=Pseudomonas aeruginosa TaxID=287 RepID=UPI0015565D9F|nr:hypothetical protein [Pseudomonas aeruginosa]MBW6125054.1 hypothetical protein [Pseudomonas aeruginosa]QKF03229.1 hypothetical protein HPT09_18200 [Pseudomonas aeruginosa]HCF1530347.1 hypothetical protein [Pseudomonas aeruginosa]